MPLGLTCVQKILFCFRIISTLKTYLIWKTLKIYLHLNTLNCHYSKQLDKDKVECHRELMQTSQLLKAYHAFGPDFEAIAQEYSHLQQEIENKNWAMKEFQQSLT